MDGALGAAADAVEDVEAVVDVDGFDEGFEEIELDFIRCVVIKVNEAYNQYIFITNSNNSSSGKEIKMSSNPLYNQQDNYYYGASGEDNDKAKQEDQNRLNYNDGMQQGLNMSSSNNNPTAATSDDQPNVNPYAFSQGYGTGLGQTLSQPGYDMQNNNLPTTTTASMSSLPLPQQVPALQVSPLALLLDVNAKWTVHTSNVDGRTYYYHAGINFSTYDKPSALMNEAERSLPMPPTWKEYRRDRKRFYHDPLTKVSKWEEPEELKIYRDELRSMVSESKDNELRAAVDAALSRAIVEYESIDKRKKEYQEKLIRMGKKKRDLSQAKELRFLPRLRRVSDDLSPSKLIKIKEESTDDFNGMSHEKRVETFLDFLCEKNVPAECTWEDALLCGIATDKRYFVISDLIEKKELFVKKYYSWKMEYDRVKQKQKRADAKEGFKKMLMECRDITPKSKFDELSGKLKEDPRFWKVLDDHKRRKIFRKYVDKLQPSEATTIATKMESN